MVNVYPGLVLAPTIHSPLPFSLKKEKKEEKDKFDFDNFTKDS